MVAFDTLSVSHDLEAAGMNRKHAEAIAHAVASAGDAARVDLATKADVTALKSDLERVELGLKSDMAELRKDTRSDLERVELGLRADMAAREVRLVKWGVGALAVHGGLVLAVLKLIP